MNRSQYLWIINGISLILTTGVVAGGLLQNMALHKPAMQSSQFESAAASRAVDGNRDSNYSRGSCSLTIAEPDPWWRVDLGTVYKVSAVIITNRYNSWETLNGAEIWIGTSGESKDHTNTRCAVISEIPSGRSVYYPCSGTEGRYVTVSLRGSSRVLSLCEVEVYRTSHAYPLPNVALKGEATQSSTLSNATASKAIDGRRNSFYGVGYCSHTAEGETNPWWRVDLGSTYTVASVKITNRGDCCAERLDGAEIRIGNSEENNGTSNPICTSISHIRAGKTSTFICDSGNMDGRFVNVMIPGEEKTLTLCEVEVYASSPVAPLTNVAIGKHSTQSSTHESFWPGYAIDRCKGTSIINCCSHTQLQYNPYWRVYLSAVHRITAVSIISRLDCCSDRLRYADLRIGYSSWYGSNPRCGMITTILNTPVYTFNCGGMKGDHIHVVLHGYNRVLSLCEVEVYGTVVPGAPTPPPPPPLTTTPPPPPTVSTALTAMNAMVVGKRLCWSDALHYCRSRYWDLLSLHSEEEQSKVQQLLSNSSFNVSDHVWVGLRRNLLRFSWFWMSGDAMRFTKWPIFSATHYSANLCGAISRGRSSLWQDHPCEESFNFICQTGPVDTSNRVYYYSSLKPHV